MADSEESEDSPEDDSEVVEELVRQGRRWRADEQARASEGERRARELAEEAAEQKKAELARQKAARKPTERVRVNRALRKDVRADHVQLPESRQSDSDSDWELVRLKSRRSDRKERARVRDHKDTEESSSGSSDDSARLRRRRRDSRRVDKEKRKTWGRDRLAATSSVSEPEWRARVAHTPRKR